MGEGSGEGNGGKAIEEGNGGRLLGKAMGEGKGESNGKAMGGR